MNNFFKENRLIWQHEAAPKGPEGPQSSAESAETGNEESQTDQAKEKGAEALNKAGKVEVTLGPVEIEKETPNKVEVKLGKVKIEPEENKPKIVASLGKVEIEKTPEDQTQALREKKYALYKVEEAIRGLWTKLNDYKAELPYIQTRANAVNNPDAQRDLEYQQGRIAETEQELNKNENKARALKEDIRRLEEERIA
jgi:hypothetical protein